MSRDAVSQPGGLSAAWSRPVAIATAGLFLLSSAFPVVAGLSKDTASFPKAWGIVDVGLAFVLILLAFVILGLVGNRVNQEAMAASYRAYRVLIHGIWVLMALFFTPLGDRIVWIHCLTGFAWRAWLLLYCLPAWLVALASETVADVRMPEGRSDRGAW